MGRQPASELPTIDMQCHQCYFSPSSTVLTENSFKSIDDDELAFDRLPLACNVRPALAERTSVL